MFNKKKKKIQESLTAISKLEAELDELKARHETLILSTPPVPRIGARLAALKDSIG